MSEQFRETNPANAVCPKCGQICPPPVGPKGSSKTIECANCGKRFYPITGVSKQIVTQAQKQEKEESKSSDGNALPLFAITGFAIAIGIGASEFESLKGALIALFAVAVESLICGIVLRAATAAANWLIGNEAEYLIIPDAGRAMATCILSVACIGHGWFATVVGILVFPAAIQQGLCTTFKNAILVSMVLIPVAIGTMLGIAAVVATVSGRPAWLPH